MVLVDPSSRGDRCHPWHGSDATHDGGLCQKLARDQEKTTFAAIRRRINCNDGRTVKAGLFYVRRHTCADGSFEWYVLNGHTRRPASKLFRTRAAAAAERARLQVKLELAKEQILKRTPRRGPALKILHQQPPAESGRCILRKGEMQSENQSPVAAFLFFVERLP